MIQLTFDDREQLLIDAFSRRVAGRSDVSFLTKRLDMGDVVIEPQAPATGPIVVVERKHVRDLMGSLFDGRLAEQSARMRQWQAAREGHSAWIALVIEGTVSATTFRAAADPDAKFRYFVKTHLQLVLDSHPSEGRLVIRTGDENETAALLLTIHKTILQHQGSVASSLNATCGSLPRKSHGDVFIRHLCCTQGVSYQRALRVREHYDSIAGLTAKMTDDPAGTEQQLSTLIGSKRVAERIWRDLGSVFFGAPTNPREFCFGHEPPAAPPKPKPKRLKRARHSSSSSLITTASSTQEDDGQNTGINTCAANSPPASLTEPSTV